MEFKNCVVKINEIYCFCKVIETIKCPYLVILITNKDFFPGKEVHAFLTKTATSYCLAPHLKTI